MAPSRRTARVALTGGIATGKSTIVTELEREGIPVVDADLLARSAVEPGTPGFAEVIATFGRDMLAADGRLDRKKLGGVVFADAQQRRTLEAIVHPRVREAVEEWFARLDRDGSAVGVADIPLLFETGRQRDFDYVVVVACAPQTQQARLIARDGLSEADANRRIAAQWPLDNKVAGANTVVWTDGTLDETARRARELAAHLRAWASTWKSKCPSSSV